MCSRKNGHKCFFLSVKLFHFLEDNIFFVANIQQVQKRCSLVTFKNAVTLLSMLLFESHGQRKSHLSFQGFKCSDNAFFLTFFFIFVFSVFVTSEGNFFPKRVLDDCPWYLTGHVFFYSTREPSGVQFCLFTIYLVVLRRNCFQYMQKLRFLLPTKLHLDATVYTLARRYCFTVRFKQSVLLRAKQY